MTTPDKHGWYRIDYSQRKSGKPPFDGDNVFISGGGTVMDAWWYWDCWLSGEENFSQDYITHWQPYPLPPEDLS